MNSRMPWDITAAGADGEKAAPAATRPGRIAVAIASSVVYPGSSHRARTSSSSAMLIRSAGLSLAWTAWRMACLVTCRTLTAS